MRGQRVVRGRMPSKTLYLDFFEFSVRPFMLVPDPDFLFWSQEHKRAYSILEFGTMSGAPITLITGEIGAGKTTLIQALLRDSRDDMTVGLISNAQGGRGEIMQWILNALSVEIDGSASYFQMFQALQDFLLAEYSAGRRVVLIIDEAQNLTLEGLEQLRMLTNINSGRDLLIQLILSGQPELRTMIRGPSMQQLAQRVAASFHLGAMDAQTTASYISHRLLTSGGSGEEFTPEACALIHEESGGVPRLVNQLCEFSLLYAWAAESRTINQSIVKQVLDDGVFFKGYQPSDEPLILFQKSRSDDG